MSVRVRAFITIIVMAILILAIGIGSTLPSMQNNLSDSIEDDMTVVIDTADRLVTSQINLLLANAANAAHNLIEAPPEDSHTVLETQNNIYPAFLALSIIKDGVIVDSAGTPAVYDSFLNSPCIAKAMQGEQVISTTILNPQEDNVVQYVCVPIKKTGDSAATAVLAATVDGMFFSRVLEDITIWETGHVFVNDAEGYSLTSSRASWVKERYNFIELAKIMDQYQSVAGITSKMIRGESGREKFFMNGEERFCVYKPVTGSGAGWSIGLIAPIKESPLGNARREVLLVGVICFFLCLVGAVAGSQVIAKPYHTIHKMVKELEHHETLLHTINDTAAVLLRPEIGTLESELKNTMGMLASTIKADQMRIFRYQTRNGEGFYNRTHEWVKGSSGDDTELAYLDVFCQQIPQFHETLISGNCVNGPTTSFVKSEQELLISMNVKSLLLVPMFLHEQFWGFVSFSDHKEERTFCPEEEGIMRSGVLLVVNALERDGMETDLIRAREEAVHNTESKSRFLANMSHEMRTPLNAIIGLSELSLTSGKIEGEEVENLKKINAAGITLLSLINDILDLSKIDSGKFVITPVDYDLPSVIHDTMTLNTFHIASKPIEFHVHLNENLPSKLRGDDLRIKQIFNNLLSNAFKYTKAGRVDWSIECEQEGNMIWLVSTITDTGIGIKPEDMKKLFSDYNQVNTKSNRRIEGTGLGLSITKRLAEMMGGGIIVESEYGKGSTFTIRFRQEFATDIPIGPEVADKLEHFSYFKHSGNRSSKLVRAQIPYARVLIVDDIVTNLDVAKGLLKPYGMQIDCVLSGREAIDLIRKEKVRYNAIFIDHMMPEMDGIEAVRIIRNEIGTEYSKLVPIIALTADAIVGNEERFLASGFQAFLSKPIDINALDAAVNRWIRDKTLEQTITDPDSEPEKTDRRHSKRRSADRSAAAAQLEPVEITGLDTAKGLERFGGDQEIYFDVLQSFAKNTIPLLDKIRNCRKENLAEYGVIVHGIKGSVRSIGGTDLGAQAETLEHAAKADKFEFVQENNARFIQDAEDLIAHINQILEKNASENLKPLRLEPDKELLASLVKACECFDVEEIDKTIEELEQYRYESGGDIIPWIKEQVNITGFDQIVERLSTSA